MYKQITRMLGWAAALLLVAGYVQAQDQSPQQVVEQTSAEMQRVLLADRALMQTNPGHVYQLVNDVLVPHFDMQRMSSLVLGRYWRRANGQQKVQFADEFRRMLVRTYATAFNQLQQWETEYLGSRMDKQGKRALVRTKVTPAGQQAIKVDYSMRVGPDGWKVYDVKIEGISLVTNYRNTFAREIRQGGMQGLIQRMAANNDQRAGQSQGEPQSVLVPMARSEQVASAAPR